MHERKRSPNRSPRLRASKPVHDQSFGAAFSDQRSAVERATDLGFSWGYKEPPHTEVVARATTSSRHVARLESTLNDRTVEGSKGRRVEESKRRRVEASKSRRVEGSKSRRVEARACPFVSRFEIRHCFDQRVCRATNPDPCLTVSVMILALELDLSRVTVAGLPRADVAGRGVLCVLRVLHAVHRLARRPGALRASCVPAAGVVLSWFEWSKRPALTAENAESR